MENKAKEEAKQSNVFCVVNGKSFLRVWDYCRKKYTERSMGNSFDTCTYLIFKHSYVYFARKKKRTWLSSCIIYRYGVDK